MKTKPTGVKARNFKQMDQISAFFGLKHGWHGQFTSDLSPKFNGHKIGLPSGETKFVFAN